MGFSQDESYLQDINLQSVSDYMNYINELKPLMLDQSGMYEVDDPKNLGFKNGQHAADIIYNKSGLLSGASEADAANRVGMSLDDFKQARRYVDTFNGVNAQGQVQKNITDADKANANEALVNMTTAGKKLLKTDDRKALEDRFKKLQDQELQQIEAQANYLQSDEGKAAAQRQRDIEKATQEQALAFADRQKKALNGEIPTSGSLSREIQSQFDVFKEAQARAGNVIMGDNADNAVAKGTNAENALSKFRDRANDAKQREIDTIVNQTGLGLSTTQLAGNLYGGNSTIQNTGQYSGTGFNQAYSTPGSPNYSGLSSMSLAGQQPYQFQQQMELERRKLDMMSGSSGAGKSGLMGSLLGAGLGAAFAAPTGGMSMLAGAQLGGMFGGSAGALL